MKIIVVEDNLDLQQEITYLLNKSGHEARGAGSAIELDRLMNEQAAEVLILDVGLPGEDGLSIARRMGNRQDLGIIMLTARGTDDDHIKGLEGGADNYLVKPVNRRLLLAALERIQQRIQPSLGSDVWLLDKREHLLISPTGMKVELTDSELVMLETMVHNNGKPASRRKLVEALGFDYMSYDERRIEVKLSRLRKKIRDCSEWGRTSEVRMGSWLPVLGQLPHPLTRPP